MSSYNLLSCSASYFARINLIQTQRAISLPTGVISLLTAKPSTSVYELTKYTSKFYSTNVPSDKSKATTQDEKTNPKLVVDSTNVDDLIFGETSNLSQFAKFKLMYKKYWYVLIPVHVTSSIGWVVGFYYLSKSGIDIPAMLEYIHLSETILEKVKGSDMGHYAIAYLCYKVITPLRYAVSLGLTTVSIKRLVLAGYIKPMPTKKEFIKMYEQKKADRAADRAKRKDDEAAKSP